MNKVLTIILLYLSLCSTSFAESYYFKDCDMDGKYTANYLINFDENIVKVSFIGNDGMLLQEWSDKIETITKDRITSKIIQSKKKKEFFTQYYLDSKSKSVTRQGYLKKHELDILRPSGVKRENFCKNVKSDWDINKIQDDQINRNLEQVLETQEKISGEKTSEKKCEGTDHKKWTDCQGKYNANDGAKFIGYFKNGNIEKGEAIYPGNSKYIGTFKNYIPHGQGTFAHSDGSKYVGDWINGKNQGQGIKTWKDGRKYIGTFKDDKRQGEGTFIEVDGSKYSGQWKNDKRHGKGTLVYSDGKTYVGQFVDGEEHGIGTCYEQDGSSVECKKDISATGRDVRNILITWKKWIKISEYDLSTGKAKLAIEKLKIDFQNKATVLCSSAGNFKILEKKIEIIEIDETPAYGLETVIKIGLSGVVECKK